MRKRIYSGHRIDPVDKVQSILFASDPNGFEIPVDSDLSDNGWFDDNAPRVEARCHLAIDILWGLAPGFSSILPLRFCPHQGEPDFHP
jgi:hypothetical protein